MPDERRHESSDLDDYEVQEPSDSLSPDPGYDPLDRGVAPPERWSAGMRYGVTADEQADGETLDELLAEEEPDDTADLTEDALADADEDDDEDDDLEDVDEDEDAGDEDVDGLLLDDGPDPRAAGWWPRTRAPIPTRKRTWSRTTPGSPAARRAPRKRPCTSSRKTTTTSARSNGPRRTATPRGPARGPNR